MDNQDTIKKFLSDVELGKSNAISVSKEILAEGETKTTVELRRTKATATPERLESPRRDHVFYTVAGFVSYLKKHKTPNSLVLGDVTRCKIIAVLDEAKQDGLECVYLKPQEHPEYTLLENMIGSRLPITRFAELAKRNRRVLGENESDGRDFAMLMQQITISTMVTACTGSGSKSVNGVMCTTEIKSGTESTAIVELPDSIVANVPLYIHRPELKFSLDLTIMANQTTAEIMADAPELPVLQHQEIREMLDEITSELAGEIETSLGEIRYDLWEYIK